MELAPIPDLSRQREIKDEYRTYPIDETHPLHKEELVPVSEFGIKGQSYYSQPNKMTGKPLPGINPEALVRVSVAERLEAANRKLRASGDVSRILGDNVELIVRDALRSAELQQHLYDVVWPKVLREANPEWNDQKVSQELPKFIAKPALEPASPTPHMTGGAVDLNLVYKNGEPVDFGHKGGTEMSLTDYHEGYAINEIYPVSKLARMARRVLYWTMAEEDFSNNPTEWWHYSYGDQMWGMFKSKPAAVYGAVKTAPDLLEK